MSERERAVVVGAGVTGLTTAVVLAEAGIDVAVVADEIPGTTSLAAGAMWGPYLVEPKDKVDRWSQVSLEVFRELANDPATGVRIASGVEASSHAEAPPDWATTLPGYRPCTLAELPSGYTSGYRFEVPLINMPVYLQYLLKRLQAAGVSTRRARLQSLEEIDYAPIVVNCSGLGARELAHDRGLYPIRGQHVIVRNPGLTDFFSEDTGSSPDLLCVYPQGDTVVLGGTAIAHDWSLSPDEASTEAILQRCAAVEPRLANAEVVSVCVGLRPTADRVRVEAEPRVNGSVLHNYGHGGAGVTLSWGCAREVLSMAMGLSALHSSKVVSE
jgi:D-amino-acid oxidase